MSDERTEPCHAGRLRRALLLATLAASTACATATNYLDPDGPRLETRHGQLRHAEAGLRVVSYNIENGRRVREAIAALGAHAALRSADLLLLQEMDAAGVETIASALELNAVYFPATNHNGHDLGNAVLSPWPIEEGWKVLLPHTTRLVGKARAAVAARVLVEGRALVVYSVHLGSPLGMSGGNRKQQAQAVLADAEQRAEPVIVGGDFNSHSVGAVFEAAGFAWPTKRVGKSIGLFSYDHVFSRGLPSDGASVGVARDVTQASDHRPVWALLRLE